MGYEMINDKLSITPHRMYAMLRLVGKFGSVPRETALNLLQPSTITNNQETSKIIYRVANNFHLLREDEGKERFVTLNAALKDIASLESFRLKMQQILLGVTDEYADNYILNQFTAWYAVQDAKVLDSRKADLEAQFHESLYPSAESRVISDQPGITAWMTWVDFLGLGWTLKLYRRDEARLIPDATERLMPLLPQLLPNVNTIPFNEFMDNLAMYCPELDGGILFNKCWDASRGNTVRGNRLSLMLSTALRVLHSQGRLELRHVADATDVWTLFPAQSYINRVTHIRRLQEVV